MDRIEKSSIRWRCLFVFGSNAATAILLFFIIKIREKGVGLDLGQNADTRILEIANYSIIYSRIHDLP